MRYGEGISLRILYNEAVVHVFVAFLWEGCIDHSWPRIDATITLIHNTLISSRQRQKSHSQGSNDMKAKHGWEAGTWIFLI